MKGKRMSNENPRIEWSQISGREVLLFTFSELLTADEAEFAILLWRKEFQSKMDKPVTLVWDCKLMKDYESEAKERWTAALKEMKNQIETIWLISDSTIIRMGASVMGMFTSLKIKPVSSESQITL